MKRLLPFIFLVIAAVGWGGPTPAPQQSRNKQLNVSISGYPESPVKLVSGTNENFTVTASITDITYTQGEPKKWDAAWIKTIVVKVGGETVASYTKGTGPALTLKNFTVRWATTHFNHNSDQEIRAEVTWHLERYEPIILPPPHGADSQIVACQPQVTELACSGGGGGSSPNVVEQLDPPDALVANVTVKVHNVAGLMSTNWDANDRYIWSPPRPPKTLAQTMLDVINTAGCTLESINHAIRPETLSFDQVDWSTAGVFIKEGTVFIGGTHGILDSNGHCIGLCDSVNDNDPSDMKIWEQIAFYRRYERVAPPHNYVGMFSCASLNLSPGDTPPYLAFDIDAATIARCYIGYYYTLDFCVESISNPGVLEPLNVFTSTIHSHLATGSTIGQAVAYANTFYRVKTSGTSNGYQDTIFRGDTYTRLWYVYLNALERQGLTQGEIDTWFHVW